MSFAHALATYLNLNLILGIGFCGLSFFAFILKIAKLKMGHRSELQLHYFTLTLALLLTCIHPLIPKNEIFAPPAKVWAAPSLKSFSSDYDQLRQNGYLRVSTPLGISTLQVAQISQIWIILGALLLLFASVSLWRDLRALLQINRHSFLVRRIGKVCIFVNPSIPVPFPTGFPIKPILFCRRR